MAAHPRLLLRGGLEADDLTPCPYDQFSKWYSQAKRAWSIEFPNAFVLSTVDSLGEPNSRIVLMKEFSAENGFIFFTNYLSSKGEEIGDNPNVALNFYWGSLQWQVRIRGVAKRVSDKESDEYFSSRPRKSQIGAWASNQSGTLLSRQELIDKFVATESRFQGSPIPRPPHWGGYAVTPKSFEFWQLRISRLHDRFIYTRSTSDDTAQAKWQIERLSP